MKYLASILLPLTLVTSTLAHGFVSKISIDGKDFKGNMPGSDQRSSIIRMISSTDPVQGDNNPNLNCGRDAKVGKEVAEAQPGSTLEFTWDAGDGGNWPHNTGPMITYMASCGTSSCADFDSTKAKWFKIHQLGRKPDNPNEFFQADLMKGAPVTVPIPKTLAAGNYIMRHEIIALHNAGAIGGAEFYPSCAQLKIGGSQTGAPTADELVSFPGAYNNNDPGIHTPNVYNHEKSYAFPGPKIAAFVGSPSSVDDSDNSPSGTATSKTPSATTTSATAPPKNTGTCKLKKKVSSSSAGAAAAAATIRPRHLSRIMRGLIAGRSSSS